MTASTQSAAAGSGRNGRPLTTSYVDLMRPDEDWRNLPDAAERRKIQNRLASVLTVATCVTGRRRSRDSRSSCNNYRNSAGQESQRTPPPENQSPSPSGTSSNNGDPRHNGAITPPMQRIGDFAPPQSWTPPAGSEAISGLGLTADGEHPLQFDTSTFFPNLQPPHEAMAGLSQAASSARRSRAVTTPSMASQGMPTTTSAAHSTGPMIMASNCNSPHVNQWGQATSPGRSDSLQVPAMAAAPGQSPMLNMCGSPEDSPFLQQQPQSTVYRHLPTLPTCTPVRVVDASRAREQPASPPLVTSYMDHPGRMGAMTAMSISSGKPLPETTAPLLHFAIVSGQVDTLRLLLTRYDININGRDSVGYTPLQRAVCNGRSDMAAILMEHGATVDGVEGFESHAPQQQQQQQQQ